jgi:hypothetical protein
MKPAKRPNRSAAKPVHVVSPATASEIRRTLGITKTEQRNVMRAFRAAGVEVQPHPRRRAPKRHRRSAGIKVHPARYKRVLVIFKSRLQTVDHIREEICIPRPYPDYDEEPVEVAVVRFGGQVVHLPRAWGVFLYDEKLAKSKA